MGEARSSLDVHSYAPAQCSGRALTFLLRPLQLPTDIPHERLLTASYRSFPPEVCLGFAMFKPTTRHNIPASSSSGPEVKLSKRSSGIGPIARWPYRLYLSVPLCVTFILADSPDSYERPPTLDITLEEFEIFAIARLRVLSHIESLSHRSLPYAQLSAAIATHLKQHLPLASNTARNVNTDDERRKDEIGHWVLRLAFCRR